MIKVTNIERFATHDGEGIRTVVFLSGCPLRCPWCANPETWTMSAKLFYNQKKCVHCQTCVHNCPTKAITMFEGTLQYDADACIHCNACVDHCLQDALQFSGLDKTVEEIMAEVRKDRDYYQTSNGGLTLSGGEPFVQFDGFMELLKAAQKEGLSVYVETTGQYPQDQLRQALPYIDTFLFDIKHVNAAKLKEVTHADLNQILTNARYISENHPDKLIIRVPVIPGFNNDQETLNAIIQLADQLHAREIHLLPYHTLGKNKYEKMGMTYAMKDIPMMKKQDLEEYLKLQDTLHCKIKIGG